MQEIFSVLLFISYLLHANYELGASANLNGIQWDGIPKGKLVSDIKIIILILFQTVRITKRNWKLCCSLIF